MKIALDAGHGSRPGRPHTGAAANGLVEDEVALDMVARIGHHLRRAGHLTHCTRPGAELVPIAERARGARTHGCDLLLSIHCNAGPPAARGVEAYAAEGDERSRAVARRLVDAVSRHGLAGRGVKWDSSSQHSRLGILRGTYRRMPAVLLELGFLTSSHDSARLADKAFREAAALSLARAIVG